MLHNANCVLCLLVVDWLYLGAKLSSLSELSDSLHTAKALFVDIGFCYYNSCSRWLSSTLSFLLLCRGGRWSRCYRRTWLGGARRKIGKLNAKISVGFNQLISLAGDKFFKLVNVDYLLITKKVFSLL